MSVLAHINREPAAHWSVLSDALPPGLTLREKLLRLRGLHPGPQRDIFLHAAPHTQLRELLGDPATLQDVPEAVQRIAAALHAGERICVYGDYDADGVTATAILVRGLRQLGGRVGYYIPHRVKEGFGLREAALRGLAAEGYQLVITADCGTSDIAEAALARSLGLDLIVTDHHALSPELPEAVAVVNPRREQGAYPYRELTGAGVAYTLLRALAYHVPGGRQIRGGELAQLAAIGTVGDVARLGGENRLLVRAGLVALNQSPLPGVRALLGCAGLSRSTVTEVDLGFKVAPRLNAAGRMDHANLACDLLLETDAARSAQLAGKIEALNTGRRATSDGMIAAASEMVRAGIALGGDVLTVYKEEWSPALLGIVAGRLSRLHSVPVIAASSDGDSVRASARSTPGLDLMLALDGCAHLLSEHGGHSQAAGFTTTFAGLREVHEHLSVTFAGTRHEVFLEVDAELRAADLTPALADDLAALAPYGNGNAEPLFGLRRVAVHGVRVFGKQRNHLSFRIPAADGREIEVVAWGRSDDAPALRRASSADIAVTAMRQPNGSFVPLQFSTEHIFPTAP